MKRENMALIFAQTTGQIKGQSVSLHKICGSATLDYVVKTASACSKDTAVVLPCDSVYDEGASGFRNLYRKDGEVAGLFATKPLWEDFLGSVLVIRADMPFLVSESLVRLALMRNEQSTHVTVYYVGEKAQVFAFSAQYLKKMAHHLQNLTTFETLLMFIEEKEGHVAKVPLQTLVVHDGITLYEARQKMWQDIALAHIQNGVCIHDVKNTYIDQTVQIGAGTVIYPGNVLEGDTVLGTDCVLYPNNRLCNVQLGQGVKVQASVLQDSVVGNHTTIGPFAYLRPGTVVGEGVRIGDFVEIKNSNIGDKTSISHLAYVGDARVGKDCNISCGVVFSNYDGNKKYQTVVKDHAFIGCNTNLIAPVIVGEGAYTAAGTTVTQDVPDDALAIGRVRQENKLGWAEKKREMNKE